MRGRRRSRRFSVGAKRPSFSLSVNRLAALGSVAKARALACVGALRAEAGEVARPGANGEARHLARPEEYRQAWAIAQVVARGSAGHAVSRKGLPAPLFRVVLRGVYPAAVALVVKVGFGQSPDCLSAHVFEAVPLLACSHFR